MKRSPMKRFFNAIFIIVLIIAIAFAGLIAFISLTEYKPDKVERIRIYGNSSKGVKKGDSIKMMSWNIGYGALGDNADFFMDGGNHVLTSSKNRVKKNIKSISGEIHKQSPDITMIQEVDEDSRRSYHINQVEKLGKAMDGSEYYYARNYKAAFVPYPIPPLGRTVNLKRCLLISRTKVKGTGKELVYINLHLEAYDKGAGKKAQTRALNRILKQEAAKGNYVIAAGDFNQTFNNVDTNEYKVQKGLWKPGIIDISEYDSSLNFVMDSTTPTCRSLDKPLKGANKLKFQYYVIDGMIYSSNIEMSYCKTVDLGFKNSDHNPVVAEIKLK